VSHVLTRVAPRSFLQNCAQVASVALLYYDHALTLPAERRLWARGGGRGAWALALNRYLAVGTYIPVAVLNFVPLGAAACSAFSAARQWLLVLSVLIVGCKW
jgi:hypothetical protein